MSQIGGQCRTVRGRFDCTDNFWTVRRTRVDERNSRGQCATHRSPTYLFGLMLCDRCDAQIHSPYLWVKRRPVKRHAAHAQSAEPGETSLWDAPLQNKPSHPTADCFATGLGAYSTTSTNNLSISAELFVDVARGFNLRRRPERRLRLRAKAQLYSY